MIACEQTPVGYCPQPVWADKQTKEWLKKLNPPDYVKDYFDRVGNQQKVIKETCP